MDLDPRGDIGLTYVLAKSDYFVEHINILKATKNFTMKKDQDTLRSGIIKNGVHQMKRFGKA